MPRLMHKSISAAAIIAAVAICLTPVSFDAAENPTSVEIVVTLLGSSAMKWYGVRIKYILRVKHPLFVEPYLKLSDSKYFPV